MRVIIARHFASSQRFLITSNVYTIIIITPTSAHKILFFLFVLNLLILFVDLPPPLNFGLDNHLTERSRRSRIAIPLLSHQSSSPKTASITTTSTKPPSFLTTAQYYARGVYGEDKAKMEAFGEPVE